jgi:D-serine dehydratase
MELAMQLNGAIKGYPQHLGAIALEQAGRQGWSVLDGDLPLPLAVLKADALEHNLAWMREFCQSRGLDIAPHGKTTMSPELYARQLAAGAWGISFATVFQAGVGARHGVPRIIIANQVMQAVDLDSLAMLLRDHKGLQVYFLVDSLAQLGLIEAWQQARSSTTVFTVLLELGIEGKRTGCRQHDTALELARAIRRSPAVRLVGIECYEGALATCNHDSDRRNVDALMQRVQELARACEAEDLFEAQEILLTAGGSAIFDLVAPYLRPHLQRPVRGVLRSGCYLTHDHVSYRRHLRCVQERLNLRESLRPALEVLCSVQSCPEPGLAILSMGKRDVSYDLDLPVALWRASLGDSQTQPAPGHWRITDLNDQHAYLRFEPQAPAHEQPQLGQVVGCGISHPCTTFDKWRWMPVVSADYRVIDAVSIHF